MSVTSCIAMLKDVVWLRDSWLNITYINTYNSVIRRGKTVVGHSDICLFFYLIIELSDCHVLTTVKCLHTEQTR